MKMHGILLEEFELKQFASQFSAGGYTAKGSLSFLPEWKTVLTNPALQIAQESPTGIKEAQDLGYQLRTRFVKSIELFKPSH